MKEQNGNGFAPSIAQAMEHTAVLWMVRLKRFTKLYAENSCV